MLGHHVPVNPIVKHRFLRIPRHDEEITLADIAPLLEKSCIGCHGKDKTKKPKGGFDATSLASVVKGGKESGAGITWGDASKSSLFKTAELGISSPDDDLAMPPKKAKERHPLTKEQLEKVKAFIESNKYASLPSAPQARG